MASARSSLIKSVPTGDATGYRIISVDYTTAPHARWPQIIDQVVAVVQALIKEGHTLKDIALFGDSAGGGMAPGFTLKMRDQKLGMPAALVLWSPLVGHHRHRGYLRDLEARGADLSVRHDPQASGRCLCRPEGPEVPVCVASLRRLFKRLPADADSGGHEGDLPEQFREAIPGDRFRRPNVQARPLRGGATRIPGPVAGGARIQTGDEEDEGVFGKAFGEVRCGRCDASGLDGPRRTEACSMR